MSLTYAELDNPITKEFKATYPRFLSSRGVTMYIGNNSLRQCLHETALLTATDDYAKYYYNVDYHYTLKDFGKIHLENSFLPYLEGGGTGNPLQLPCNFYIKLDSFEEALEYYFKVKKVVFEYDYLLEYTQRFDSVTMPMKGKVTYHRTLNPNKTWKSWWEGQGSPEQNYYGVYPWFQDLNSIEEYAFAEPKDFACEVGGVYHADHDDRHPRGGSAEQSQMLARAGDLQIYGIWEKLDYHFGRRSTEQFIGYALKMPHFAIYHYQPRGDGFYNIHKVQTQFILDRDGNDVTGDYRQVAPLNYHFDGTTQGYASIGIGPYYDTMDFSGTGDISIEYFKYDI